MTKPKVLLALPRLGNPVFENGVAALVHASDDRIDMTAEPRDCSLLAYGFNIAWCKFANDPSYTHFAMLHADVHASMYWIDTLIYECKDFDVVHAPVAIKDDRGYTSTGLGLPFQPFGRVRRITTKELQRLPQTFDGPTACAVLGEPADYCLLPNTGCMLVKRENFPFNGFPGFQITDRVYHDGEKFCPQVEPEDWAFGRWCCKAGVRVGATTKVVTTHYGRAEFRSDRAWGHDVDVGACPPDASLRQST